MAFCLTPCGSPARDAARAAPGADLADEARSAELGSPAASVSYFLNLKLSDPAAAPAFADARMGSGEPECDLSRALADAERGDANLVRNERRALFTGSSLLTLLALASIAVLVGGRMAAQRRVGLLKALGATPGLVAAVLLAEYAFLALGGAVAGLAIGRLAAPLLTRPGAGLIGSPGSVHLAPSTVELVVFVALGVAALGTLVPAWRSSRVSAVLALADSARPPRRSSWLIALSASCAGAPDARVCGWQPAAAAHPAVRAERRDHGQRGGGRAGGSPATRRSRRRDAPGLADPRADRLNQVLLVLTVMFIALAAVNALFITWATVLDARHSSALARAMGATPQEVSTGLAAAQVLPALAGALAGIPGGIGLFAAVSTRAEAHLPLPGCWPCSWAPLVIALLTAIPVGLSLRRPIASILQSEAA